MAERGEAGSIKGKSVIVWEGFMTAVFTELQIPGNYYSIVTRILKTMGSAECIERGGGRGRKPSKWVLWESPTQDAYEKAKLQVQNRVSSKLDPLEQKINNLIESMPKFDVAKAMSELERKVNRQGRRITALENKIKEWEEEDA
jgi:hypothetical protein